MAEDVFTLLRDAASSERRENADRCVTLAHVNQCFDLTFIERLWRNDEAFMIVSRTSVCLRRRCLRARSTTSPTLRVNRRFASSQHGGTSPDATAVSHASPLIAVTNELDRLAPRLDVAADDIDILHTPSAFYEALKAKIASARRRIFLSTLYIGKDEIELRDTIAKALRSNPRLKVSILTDALRGTREAPQPSCASLLLPLIEEFGNEQVEICMYHTPNLVGTRKALLPKRINEGWGLQHMKLYGVDDEIILSGANLSDDYFTNRQDRYHVFYSKLVTNYFARVHHAVCQLSYRVLPDRASDNGFSLTWPEHNVQPEPLKDAEAYISAATQSLKPLTSFDAVNAPRSDADTSIYPLLQLTPLLKPDTSTELPALTTVLRHLASRQFTGAAWTFTAGYFNMTRDVRNLLLESTSTTGTVIAASPWANGFFGSKGVSGMLPAAYTLLSRRFVEAVAKRGLSDRISVREWRHGTVNTPGGWTYHAKGVWITLPSESFPSISLIGSSNYTKRSYSLDLEANALIVTRNADLQSRLHEEVSDLREHTKAMQIADYTTNERRVGLHVRLAMWIVTLVGGAL